MKQNCILQFLFVIFFQLSYSQIENDTILYAIKNEFIEKYPNRITAKTFYINTYNSYVFGDRDTDMRLEMNPNKQNRIGASVSYGIVALSYSFAPDFMVENRDNEDSRLFNLNFKIFLGKWMQTIDVYSEKGFYETNNFDVYLPDTKTIKIGGSTNYIFNENFSFRAISNQDEKQLKSTGSFIAGLTTYYSKFNLRGETENGYADEDLYLFDIALTPSYYYNFVLFSNFLVSVGGNVGLGLNYSKSDENSYTSLLTEWSVSSTATYNINDFYFGANFNYLAMNHNTDRSTYTEDNIPFFKAFIGYRFKAPKKMVKTYEDIKDKIKL
ncbi:DUF4421 family protein [Formosa haliotis]|uniref:DUF4421 family protein n=1 Tax=Formosa haliotis TaxID=1555194 RepID=UPI000824E802|nr:DUF4421 family protein [Formosa haliotis]